MLSVSRLLAIVRCVPFFVCCLIFVVLCDSFFGGRCSLCVVVRRSLFVVRSLLFVD